MHTIIFMCDGKELYRYESTEKPSFKVGAILSGAQVGQQDKSIKFVVTGLPAIQTSPQPSEDDGRFVYFLRRLPNR